MQRLISIPGHLRERVLRADARPTDQPRPPPNFLALPRVIRKHIPRIIFQEQRLVPRSRITEVQHTVVSQRPPRRYLIP